MFVFLLFLPDLEICAISLSLVGETTIFRFVKDAVDDLQNAVKCAVGQLNDEIPSGMLRVLMSFRNFLGNCRALLYIRVSWRSIRASSYIESQ
jgi:hypothetical protein